MASAIVAATMSAAKPSATTHPYTCNTCQVAFKGSELQRGHMQSDWHRYNLKRRVASLPPLTSEIFAEKVLANQASAAATAARASFETLCAACERTYYSQNAYQNHLKSQKHKARLLQLSQDPDASTEAETESMISSTYSLGRTQAIDLGDDVDDSDEDEEEEDDEDQFVQKHISNVERRLQQTHLDQGKLDNGESTLSTPVDASSVHESTTSEVSSATPTLQCLFCNSVSADIPTNLLHMSKSHGLFIPEQSYLVDLPGLLSYLHDRVHALHECLYCGQLKYTTSGIQTHMRDKGHCMIAFDSEADMVEVGEFYDFTSTYSDEEDEESDVETEDGKSNGVKLGASRPATIVAADGTELPEDEDWEEASGDDDDDEEEAQGEGAKPEAARKSRRNQAFEFDGELYLPSGRTAGHRSLARYFRQNLHNYPSAAERVAMEHEARLRTIEDMDSDDEDLDDSEQPANGDRRLQRDSARANRGALASRANGGLGLASAPEHVRRAAAKMEVKEKRREQRAYSKFKAGNERQNNNQKHFRDPLLQ